MDNVHGEGRAAARPVFHTRKEKPRPSGAGPGPAGPGSGIPGGRAHRRRSAERGQAPQRGGPAEPRIAANDARGPAPMQRNRARMNRRKRQRAEHRRTGPGAKRDKDCRPSVTNSNDNITGVGRTKEGWAGVGPPNDGEFLRKILLLRIRYGEAGPAAQNERFKAAKPRKEARGKATRRRFQRQGASPDASMRKSRILRKEKNRLKP